MITDNLATLFESGQPGVRFRQGTILTWNSNTGANTISLAGGTLTNVPVLNTGEAIALKAGHVVGLLGQGSSWFIVGRVTPPNDPNFAGASVAFGGNGASATNFSLTTSAATKVSTTIAVPSWADEAVVLATGNCTLVNPRTVQDFATMLVYLDGISGGQSQSGFAASTDTMAGYEQTLAASAQRVITPGATITAEVKIWANGAAWSASSLNIANIDVIAVFRSIA